MRQSDTSTDGLDNLALIIKDLLSELGKVRTTVEESRSADAITSEKLRELQSRVDLVYRVVVTGNGSHALVTDVELLKAGMSEIHEDRTQGRRASRMFRLGVLAQFLTLCGIAVAVFLTHAK